MCQAGPQGAVESGPRPDHAALISLYFTVSVYAEGHGVAGIAAHSPIAIVMRTLAAFERIIDAFEPPYFLPPQLIEQARMTSGWMLGLDTRPVIHASSAMCWLGRSPAFSSMDATRVEARPPRSVMCSRSWQPRADLCAAHAGALFAGGGNGGHACASTPAHPRTWFRGREQS